MKIACIAVVLACVAADTLSQLIVGAPLNDLAELLVFAEELHVSYDEQPPFLTWVAYAVRQVTGPADDWVLHFGLTINLAATKLGVMWIAGRSGGAHAALLAAAITLLIPTVGLDLFREVPHTSTLLAGMIVGAAALTARSHLKRNTALAGLAWGVAMAAKWQMGLLIVAWALAVAMTRTGRARRAALIRAAGAALIAVGLSAPAYIAAFMNADTLQAGASDFFLERTVAARLGDLVGSVVGEGWIFVLLAPLAGALIRFRIHKDAQAMLVAGAIFSALLFGACLVGGMTVIRDRWFSPGFVLAAPGMAIWLTAALKGAGSRIAIALSVVVISTTVLIRGLEPMMLAATGGSGPQTWPIDEFSQQVAARYSLGEHWLVIADTPTLANSLKEYGPAATIAGPFQPRAAQSINRALLVHQYAAGLERTRSSLEAFSGDWTCKDPVTLSVPLRFQDERMFAAGVSACRRRSARD